MTLFKVLPDMHRRLHFRGRINAGYFCAFSISILLFSSLSFQNPVQPDPRFRVTEAFWAPEDAVDLGVGWERILFYWKEIQPGGPEDWNTLHVREEWLDEAASSGREVVGLLKNTAIWASEDGTEAGLPSGLYLPVDDPMNYWANFTRKIAQYYAPRNVHNWIIWNEPEITSETYGFEFAGSVEDYYQLLKVAYQVIKEEDPQANIHLAGVTWWHDQTFLRRLFEVAAADPESEGNDSFFDVVSLHIYFRPETVLSIISDVQGLLQEFGLDKRIWLNETNAPPNLDPDWPVERPAFDVDLEQQSWFVIQATALAMSVGIDRIAVYKLVDIVLPEGAESFGLIRQDGSRRPAFDAYASTINHLTGFTQASLKVHPHYYVASFVSPEYITRILWARTTQAVTLHVPAVSSDARIFNYKGNSTIVSSTDEGYTIALTPALCYDECLIGGPPLTLIEELSDDEIDQVEDAVAIAGIYPTALAFSTATPFPSSTPSATSTPTPTPRNSMTPSATSTPTLTPRNSMTPSATSTPTLTPRNSMTPSPNPTNTGTSTSMPMEKQTPLPVESPTEVFQEPASIIAENPDSTPLPASTSAKPQGRRTDRLDGYSGLILIAFAIVIYALLVITVFHQRSTK